MMREKIPNIICPKCGTEKPRKNFQKDSKEYKSCNECRLLAQKLIDEGFNVSFELMDNLIGEDFGVHTNKQI